jgi:Uma2 family endonuclease
MQETSPRPPIKSALAEGRLTLSDVPWKTYLELRELPENEHLLVTYDEGTLEMISLSATRLRRASLINNLVHVWAEERGIDMEGCGSMTCRREDLRRAFESDNCYYVANEPAVRQKRELDFAVDPPPDLVIEIDDPRRSARKLAVFAAFRVPEVWCFDGHSLAIFTLGAECQYDKRLTSVTFPGLPPGKLERVLATMGMESETALVRSFRDWVRAQ